MDQTATIIDDAPAGHLRTVSIGAIRLAPQGEMSVPGAAPGLVPRASRWALYCHLPFFQINEFLARSQEVRHIHKFPGSFSITNICVVPAGEAVAWTAPSLDHPPSSVSPPISP